MNRIGDIEIHANAIFNLDEGECVCVPSVKSEEDGLSEDDVKSIAIHFWDEHDVD